MTKEKERFFTLTGCNHYFGNDFLKAGMKVKLVKEPDNEYDHEAIKVKLKGLGKKVRAEVVYVIPNGAVCKLAPKGIVMDHLPDDFTETCPSNVIVE